MSFPDENTRAEKYIRGYNEIREKLRRSTKTTNVIHVIRMDNNDKIILLRHHFRTNDGSSTLRKIDLLVFNSKAF